MQSTNKQRDVRRRLCLSMTLCAFVFVPASVRAQSIVDKMVATINNHELITYTDLLWQLALQPETPIDEPRTDDLNRVLQLLIDQRLIAEEAGKLPSIAPRDEDVEKALAALINRFPSREGFYQRIARVGLTPEQLREIVRQRVEIENYLDFRFRSFTVVTQADVAAYYRDVFVPRFRRQSPGRILPTQEEATPGIERALTEGKIESDTDAFLEDARTRAEIVILSPV